MYVQKRSQFRALMGCMLATGGCGNFLNSEGREGSRPTLNLSAIGLNPESTHIEEAANNLFERAEFVDFTERSTIVGSISSPSDMDVYDLGPVQPGDHIAVTMQTDDTLDGAIALFDSTGTALLVDDHRNVYLGRAEPFIDVIIRRASPSCYVAVSATPGYGAEGQYSLIASKDVEVQIPNPRPDRVLLVFDGGKDVRIGGRPAVRVPEFHAANISPEFANQSSTIMEEVLSAVRQDYQNFNVTILSTGEGTTFEPGMTRVFFGTYDEALLGIAQGVDEFNSISGQSAIVFTDTFEAFMLLEPSVSELSQAIANVASHEIGHLLGLVHSEDPEGIMDVTASLAELLVDQTFRRSPIYHDVFSLGYQDEIRSLLDTVGGHEPLAETTKLAADRRPVRAKAKSNHPPARAGSQFSSCGLCAPRSP